MNVFSADIEPGQALADIHAADGGNRPPRIQVSDVPGGALELALVVDDPDAPIPGGFTHWLRFGIPADADDITSEGIPHRDGENGFGRLGYGGPMPPSGHGVHHYYFWVYALSRPVVGEPGRLAFLSRYSDAVVAQERLVGTYERPTQRDADT